MNDKGYVKARINRSGEKVYLGVVENWQPLSDRVLRRRWKRATDAKAYGLRVAARYQRLLRAFEVMTEV